MLLKPITSERNEGESLKMKTISKARETTLVDQFVMALKFNLLGTRKC